MGKLSESYKKSFIIALDSAWLSINITCNILHEKRRCNGEKTHITQTTHARTLSSILLHEIQNRILIQFHNKPDVHKNFNFCIIITGMIFAGKCAFMIYIVLQCEWAFIISMPNIIFYFPFRARIWSPYSVLKWTHKSAYNVTKGPFTTRTLTTV